MSEMIAFDVKMMEVPIMLEHGKDVVINWDFVGFNSNDELWYDANGLQMVYKQLWKRQDYNVTHPTKNIASNFYPV